MKIGNKEIQFVEAIEFLQKRKPVTKEEFMSLTEDARAKAFTVSGYTAAEILNQFLLELQEAAKNGTTYKDFKDNMDSFLERNGYEGINPWKAENIFRTNLQTAYNAGHYKRMSSPNLIKARPYWQYHTAGDGQVRKSHAQMEGRVYAATDPIWDVWYPPNGYKCRCTVVSLTAAQVEKIGIPVYTRPPFDQDLKTGRITFTMPDKGFTNNPAKVVWKPDLKKLRPEVQKAYKNHAKNTTS